MVVGASVILCWLALFHWFLKEFRDSKGIANSPEQRAVVDSCAGSPGNKRELLIKLVSSMASEINNEQGVWAATREWKMPGQWALSRGNCRVGGKRQV